MKYLIVLFPALVFAGGFSFGMLVGGNYQWLDLDLQNLDAGDGIGYHLGLFLDKSITPSTLPFSLSTELDFIYYRSNYTWDVAQIGQEQVLAELNLNSLYAPLYLKLNLNSPAFGFSLGLGGFLLHNLSGKGKYKFGGIVIEDDLESDDLETDFGFVIKASGVSKLAPMVYFYPALAYRHNLTADDPDTEGLDESERGIEFRVGLGISI